LLTSILVLATTIVQVAIFLDLRRASKIIREQASLIKELAAQDAKMALLMHAHEVRIARMEFPWKGPA
jgi:hypothetical protein